MRHVLCTCWNVSLKNLYFSPCAGTGGARPFLGGQGDGQPVVAAGGRRGAPPQ